MQKINYPEGQELTNLRLAYYNTLTKKNEEQINQHLSRITQITPALTYESLIQLDFDKLIEYAPKISDYRNGLSNVKLKVGDELIESNPFDILFNYKANQPGIASFFMNQPCFKLKTCCYCGIDYINAFRDLEDYKDGLDFINRAQAEDLACIKGMDEIMVNDIIAQRALNQFTDVSDAPCVVEVQNEIERLVVNNTHNHFTLDHVLPQNRYRFYSLCLYNLVPSCYSCNSKFKKALEFNIDPNLTFISPTSSNYKFPEDFEFRFLYPNKKFKDISSEEDFILTKDVTDNADHINNYFSIFKLAGRYTFHKELVLRQIKQRAAYSDSKISELSRLTGLPESELREMIFGKELFDQTATNEPMIKFKKDIARQIGIL
jgi:hypothetical protein